jgi:ComF family protein
MAGNAATIVHALKYGGWDGLAEEMGRKMGRLRFAQDVETELSAVVAVPLSRVRLRERGFNQAELLARTIAEFRRLPLLVGVLQRQRHTQRQARLSPPERQTNVSRAFKVDSERRARINGQHVLLVDDVLTTAATVLDCVRALCSSGARAVSVLTFARARRELPT